MDGDLNSEQGWFGVCQASSVFLTERVQSFVILMALSSVYGIIKFTSR